MDEWFYMKHSVLRIKKNMFEVLALSIVYAVAGIMAIVLEVSGVMLGLVSPQIIIAVMSFWPVRFFGVLGFLAIELPIILFTFVLVYLLMRRLVKFDKHRLSGLLALMWVVLFAVFVPLGLGSPSRLVSVSGAVVVIKCSVLKNCPWQIEMPPRMLETQPIPYQEKQSRYVLPLQSPEAIEREIMLPTMGVKHVTLPSSTPMSMDLVVE